MNYLQLCQRTAVECGVASNSAIAAVMPTVVGATGSLGRVANWTAQAWTEIQMFHEDWDWMRSSNILGKGIAFQTIAGQPSYPLGSGPGTVGVTWEQFGKWDQESFRSETTTEGFEDEMFLDDIPFDTWRDSYMLGAMRNVKTRPVAIAVGPDQSLNLGPPPDAEYTITGDYFVAPQVLALDADVPLKFPTRFHMLIVYRAMVAYGGYEAASEVTQRGADCYARMFSQLLSVRAPRLTFGGAIA